MIFANLLMMGFSVWSFSKPSKAWQVSKSSEARFIASEDHAPEQESFEEMLSFESPCDNQNIETKARYVRLKLDACELSKNTKWKIINKATGSEAHILKNESLTSTDFIYLADGENLIELQAIDEKDSRRTYQIAFQVSTE
jgi:hypothetical protein